mmetsp:Transcript_7040/g.24042  ORF Transcript_7040/g.24042 Transcript_7040/m.24042 type:complete len:182 (+) Transcript_7040:86-631(+)
MAPLLDTEAFSGVLLVTGAYIWLFYALMMLGPSAHETGRSEAQQRWGHRSFLNMQEQSPAFLVSLWGCAVAVDPADAARLGAAYLCLRACYPLIWMARGKFDPTIFLCTIPQYGIVLYMATACAYKGATGSDLKGLFLGSCAAGSAVFAAIFFAEFFGACALNRAVTAVGFFREGAAAKKA